MVLIVKLFYSFLINYQFTDKKMLIKKLKREFLRKRFRIFHANLYINSMKKIIIASTSTLYGGNYLDYLLPELKSHFYNCNTILCIPFARPGGISQDEFTSKVAQAFAKIGKKVKGIHEFEDYSEAIVKAKGIFTGGGNTFLLVSQLQKNNILNVLAETIKKGTPYLGTSAGSIICGLTMQNTNDMPIVFPPSLKTLGLIPFNLKSKAFLT